LAAVCEKLQQVGSFLPLNQFLHGHAPGKNTLTRRFFRRKTAKPHRSAELFVEEIPASRSEEGL
jgi:hypothetical protein